jgi:cytochrome b561
MKLLPALVCVSLLLGSANQAVAGKKKKSHKRAPPADDTTQTVKASEEEPAEGKPTAVKPAEDKPAEVKQPLDFDFFGDGGAAGGDLSPDADDLTRRSHTRRWMLQTHQTLGLATWVLMAATVTIGQLNYNQLWGNGGGSRKWQSPHQYLVLSTSVAFAATAAFAIFAPTPYKKPLGFDTGLLHRIAAIGATLGMVTEGLVGWLTTHQANAGNPNNTRNLARTHQIVGYATFGFLTIAGTVWVF